MLLLSPRIIWGVELQIKTRWAWGWYSGILPRLQPLGPRFESHLEHYVEWGFCPYLTVWVFPRIILWGFPTTSKTEISLSSSLLVWLFLERWEHLSRSRSRLWTSIHILTGNEVTSIRLFPRGTSNDHRPLFWSLKGPRGNRRTLVIELCQSICVL